MNRLRVELGVGLLRMLIIASYCLVFGSAYGREREPTFVINGDRFSALQANDYKIGLFPEPLTEEEMLRRITSPNLQATESFLLEKDSYFYFAYLVDNQSGRTQTTYLRYPLWFPDSNAWLLKDNQLVPFQRYPRWGDVFYIDLPPGRHWVLGLRVSGVTMAGRASSVRLMDFQSLTEDWTDYDAVTIAVFGAVIAMVFYNLGMYVVYRRIYFIFYALYSAASLYAVSIISTYEIYTANRLGISILIAGLSLLAFCNHSLNLRKKFPRLYRTSQVVGILGIVLTAYSTITGSWLGFAVNLPIVMSFCLLTSVVSLRSGYRPALYFVLGWSIFMVCCCLVSLNVVVGRIPYIQLSAIFGFAFEISLFSFAIGQKVRLSEQEALQANHHAFNQLKKVFYPHQISKIKEGIPIEETMPTHEAEAAAICFDIIGSSQMEASIGRRFIEDSIKACVSTLGECYDGNAMVSAGYRVKEVGDGFLCTVGYPFHTVNGKDSASAAMELALHFLEVFQAQVNRLENHPPIFCSVALAFGSMQGHFPKIGVAEYDVDGRAVDLAQRYESFRKRYFTDSLNSHVVTVHSLLFDQLPSRFQKGFQKVDLRDAQIVVRDDPSVTHLYYCLFAADAVSDHLQVSA